MKEESYQLLLSLGYTNKKAQEIVNSSLLHSHKDETLFKNILNVYNYLKKYYTKNEIIKMTKTLPSLYNFSTESIKQKIEDMMSLGYTRKEVIEMTKKQPSLYSVGIETIKQKINDMMHLGYTRKEVIRMTKQLPALFGYSIDNIKRKINFYKSINLENIVLEDTKLLMQSVTLSYARYRYLKSREIIVNINSYSRLFYC